MKNKTKILFLCTTNSYRSQMAEGIVRHHYGDLFDVYSAGAMATYVHPLAIRVMAEIGTDISHQKSKTMEELIERVGQEFDYVITLCGDDAKDVCPLFIGKARVKLSWNFEDPAKAKGSEEEILEVFRRVRDKIKFRIDGK